MPDKQEVVFGVSDFIAVFNQTVDYAYPGVTISGELANLRISKNRWIYFDLKDEISTLKFFGSVQQLPGPLEDGMLLKVRGQPRLHHLYGFSVNVLTIQPAGEGTIRRAAQLLQAKLAKEGLFDESRKRALPYPPRRIGLVASRQSAAYADFIKILGSRWRGIAIELVDVRVQGEAAPAQIVGALERLGGMPELPDAVVLVRGGGSAEDLAAFNTELVTRAVAASRVPTLVAIGHETDLSLAELAADRRASTPSNAAELLVPDRRHVLAELRDYGVQLERLAGVRIKESSRLLERQAEFLTGRLAGLMEEERAKLKSAASLLQALNPEAVLRRGYAIVRQNGRPLRSASRLAAGAIVEVQLADGRFRASVAQTKQGKA